jgi:hypothetical protein
MTPSIPPSPSSHLRTAASALAMIALVATPLTLVPEARATAMGFTSSVVTPAVGFVQDLYEPTITAAAHGSGVTLYVAGHVIGADTTGTPAYYNDLGTGWKQMPIVSTVAPPSPVQGAAPPGGDEATIVADASGHAWMVDTMASANQYVQGFCSNGAAQCFYQPDAYNPAADVCGLGVSTVSTDRPWAAHATVGGADKLLLVNNGYLGTVGNVAQIGLLDVTPGLPVGAVPPTWNPCAGGGNTGGFIPGVPSLSSAGRFVVPQIQGSSLKVITGTVAGGVGTTTTTAAFTTSLTDLACSANWGFSGISSAGTFYVTDATDLTHFKVSATTTGTTFKTTSFATTDDLAFLWISGSKTGEGALATWAESKDGSACGDVDFYAAHITLDGSGFPQMSDKTLVASAQSPCGDLMGSDVGPDGNAYLVIFSDPLQCLDTPLSHPLTVYAQTSGPTI